MKLEQVKEAMRNDIQQGRRTVAELSIMREKDLAAEYRVSRDTARKARKAVLLFVEN
jgi:DNA-binding GntR family transcriptional regulator